MGKPEKPFPELPLGEKTERLLHWLERYPFQRAQDLVLALAPWEKRTTIYERIADLERLHLIEGLRVGVAQKKRLYHLAPLGTYVCDHLAVLNEHEHQEQQTRWERHGIGQVVQGEREKLMRLLPRLPLFLLLQDAVNGLVSNAGAALTSQGHHARMIQWNWLRDYSRTFTSPNEHALRLQVEGALALCLRFTPVGSRPPAETAENWYTCFLLHCPLDEVRLMRMRLDRLLRWRESAERTAVYSWMPPLLILATTERQAEWWHQATVQMASRLHLAYPAGAIACLPPKREDAVSNPWHLSWRRLGTREFCHVQDLLHPWPAPSVPELLALRGTASERTHVGNARKAETPNLVLPPRLRQCVYALAEKAEKAQSMRVPIQHHGNATRDYRFACISLTPRHWEILRLCFAHPLLSREDLAQLLVLSRTTVNMLLSDLTHAGYMGSVETLIGERWQVIEAGLNLLARLASCHVHRLVRFPLEEGTPLMQRGVPGLLHQIRHTAGVYAFFAQLSKALATRPDASVQWWETGVLSERHFQFREKTYRFRPDALAAVHLGERTLRFWLEWDRGTMTPRDLQIKFATYAMYLTSREWASSSPYLPAVVCVAPDIAQEHRLTKAATQRLVQAPSSLCMYTTTASLLLTQGMLKPIWRQVELPKPHQQQSPPDTSPRVSLFC